MNLTVWDRPCVPYVLAWVFLLLPCWNVGCRRVNSVHDNDLIFKLEHCEQILFDYGGEEPLKLRGPDDPLFVSVLAMTKESLGRGTVSRNTSKSYGRLTFFDMEGEVVMRGTLYGDVLQVDEQQYGIDGGRMAYLLHKIWTPEAVQGAP